MWLSSCFLLSESWFLLAKYFIKFVTFVCVSSTSKTLLTFQRARSSCLYTRSAAVIHSNTFGTYRPCVSNNAIVSLLFCSRLLKTNQSQLIIGMTSQVFYFNTKEPFVFSKSKHSLMCVFIEKNVKTQITR